MKHQFKIITEIAGDFEKELQEYFKKGWVVEIDSYRVFEYAGRIHYSIMMSKEGK